MKTVKQVSDLTGISVRMLHHYDKIGLLKPTELTKSGYRLYDNEALGTLQQILFFKELDLPLKEIRKIMASPDFDRMKALENHKRLITLKRDRLNGLIELINKTLKGENTMSFIEFDMSEYYDVWKEYYRKNNEFEKLTKFEEAVEKMKIDEVKIAKNIIKQYGSINKAVEVIRKNLNDDMFKFRKEKFDKFKNDLIYDKHPKLKELYKGLTADLTKAPASEELQQIAKEITNIAKKDYEVFKTDRGDSLWYHMMITSDSKWIKVIDGKYKRGSGEFIREVFKIYLRDKKPKLDRLYEKLAADLSKEPTSREIQETVEDIAAITKGNIEFYQGDTGISIKGFFSVMAELYLLKPEFIKGIDKKYGEGASKFIGQALKFYSENKNIIE